MTISRKATLSTGRTITQAQWRKIRAVYDDCQYVHPADGEHEPDGDDYRYELDTEEYEAACHREGIARAYDRVGTRMFPDTTLAEIGEIVGAW